MPGVRVSLGLVNGLVVDPSSPQQSVEDVFAFDPTSIADRPRDHVAGLHALASELHGVMVALDERRVADAADLLNRLLAVAPPVPHLVLDDHGWSLHQHRPGAGLVEAWTSICANAPAGATGEGHDRRVHLCAAPDCLRAFVDSTKNGSRRFCSERCQNRVKAAARRRRLTSPPD